MPLDENLTGTVEAETGDGKIVVQYKDGQKNGVTRYISSSGSVLSEIEYKDDVIDGTVTQYYPSGMKLSRMEYKNGKLDGAVQTFYENGVTQMKAEYKEGNLTGEYTAYDEFGDKVEICTYYQGLKHGTDTIYYPRSQGGGVYEISTYCNGMLEGDKISFNQDGAPVTLTTYKNGRAQQYPKNFKAN